ncbi:MAG: hypothetical protein AAFX06_06520 [Planctomycetota bacterium]
MKRNRLILLIIVMAVSAVAFLNRKRPIQETEKTLPHLPTLDAIELSSEEVDRIIDALVRTEAWFNTLESGRFEYEATMTKSETRYRRDLKEMQASFPETKIDEATDPTLQRRWNIEHQFSFDKPLAMRRQAGTLGDHSDWWDGEKLTGYVDYGTEQEPNYYIKASPDQMGALGGWFPMIGTPAIWFANTAGSPYYSTWKQEPPTIAGGLRFAGHECVVLQDKHHHWIVGRTDHHVYGKYNHHEIETFSNHQEVADGVFWPTRSTRQRFGKQGLEWTDEVTVASLAAAVDPKSFELELRAGVKMCDLREPVVTYVIDPGRTPAEMAKLYAAARQDADRFESSKRRGQALIGQQAPELGEGTWINGNASLLDFWGKKSFTLGFGHTACTPCSDMLAMFARLQDNPRNQLVLVYSSTDSVKSVQAKLKRFGLNCPTFIPKADTTPHGQVFDDYRVAAFPTIVELNSEGKITSHRVGTLVQE